MICQLLKRYQLKIRIIKSGSSANCYLIHGIDETIIIEAGINIPELLEELKFDTSHVSCCLVSHSHNDHAKYLKKYSEMGIRIFATQETFDVKKTDNHWSNIITKLDSFETSEFEIKSFPTEHDCPGSIGFLIKSKVEQKSILFATDTFYLKYKFKNIHCYMIESNYQNYILEENIERKFIDPFLAKRLKSSHFSFKNVQRFLTSTDLSLTKNIILIHSSSRNSNRKEMKKTIENLFKINTTIAIEKQTVRI